MSVKHTIVYAEDDLDDLFIVKQAFERYDGQISIVHSFNGFEALEELARLRQANTLPCLVLLDINMPGMDGRETLIHLKQQDDYKDIPVVLFTTSSSPLDKAFAAKWGAQFFTKPLVYSEMENMVKTFMSFCGIEQ